MSKKKNVKIKMNTDGSCNSGVRFISALVSVTILSFAVVTADVTFTTRIKDISSDLGKALNNIFVHEDVVYTNFTDNSIYLADVEYNPKGMTGLYNITHFFIDLIQSKDLLPKDLELIGLVDYNGHFNFDKLLDQWQIILKHYAGLLTLIIVGLLFAILMPFIGFIFCCCRCCGNCGARSQPFDKKHDMCRKVLLAMFLIGVATLILFGVVCAFVSNQHMQEGIDELPKNLKNSMSDVRTYVNSTNSQINVLLVKNYEELSSFMSQLLYNSSEIITSELMALSNAVTFTKLETFVVGMTYIKTNLSEMQGYTKDLRNKASQLNDGLRRVKHELLHTLRNCSNKRIKTCQEVNDHVAKLGTTVDFDSYLDRYFPRLPDVKQQIQDLETHVSDGLIKNITQANDNFKDIPNKINETVVKNIPEIEDSLNRAGESLKNATSEMEKTLKDVDKILENSSDKPINDAEYFITQYSIYRYYVGLFVGSILLLVILCVTFGLMCGICGKRPDGYDDDCCNKGAGSKFLMLGVAVMFLFSIVLMLVTLAYFLTGVVLQRLICDTLRDPEANRKVFDLLDKNLNSSGMLQTDIVSIITSCHRKKSVYHVLRLENKFNVNEIPGYLEKYGIKEKIDEFKNKINFDGKVEILTVDTKGKVEELKHSSIVDLPIHRFIEILETNLTSINLTELSNELQHLSNKLGTTSGSEDYVMSINQNIMYLRMYQKNLVDPMVVTADKMKEKAINIENSMKFNHTNFTEAIDGTLSEVEVAQDYINDKGKAAMAELASAFGDSVEGKLNFYLNRVANIIAEDVGRCTPLSNVYNNTLIATCDKIFNPWNGFWISVGWCLILFIPTIILSVKLSTLYQKSDPYPGPLVEHEYLYDAYADRDNIPLSNTGGKKGKKKKKHRGEVYEARGYQGPSEGPRVTETRTPAPRERDAPGGSSHPDTRYADMAPKHWEDYPNGGPPQYQSAPLATEYERPPPYYYPGPGDRP